MKRSLDFFKKLFDELLTVQIADLRVIQGMQELPHTDEYFLVLSGEAIFGLQTEQGNQIVELESRDVLVPRHCTVSIQKSHSRVLSIRVLARQIFLTFYENAKAVDRLTVSCFRESNEELYKVVELMRYVDQVPEQGLWVKSVYSQLIILIKQLLLKPENMMNRPLWTKRDYLAEDLAHYIVTNLDQKLSREEVAAHFDYSGNALNMLLKDKYGQSFRDYLLGVRMEKALLLLKAQSLKVKEISRLCGYEHVEHFVALFRKRFGLTPLKYRRTMTDNPKELLSLTTFKNLPQIDFHPWSEDKVLLSKAGERTSVTLFNPTDREFEVYWINHNGEQEYYAILHPRSICNIRTYLNHYWLLKQVALNNHYYWQVEFADGLCQVD